MTNHMIEPIPARFISVEGIDGVGKSTFCQQLVTRLKESGVSTIATIEPGATEFGQSIRTLLLSSDKQSAMADTLLFFADRVEHITRVIAPSLQAGIWVVSDRYIDSTYAYQTIHNQVQPGDIDALATSLKLLMPTVTFLLTTSLQVAGTRRSTRKSTNRLELDLEKVQKVYQQRAQDDPDRIHVLDATKPVDAVVDQAMQHLSERFSGSCSS